MVTVIDIVQVVATWDGQNLAEIQDVANHWRDICPPETTKYYSLGGRRVAMRKDGMLYYLFTDHLGSTSVTYNTANSQTQTLRYYPWGSIRSGDVPTDRRFTGQRWDATIDLYDYNARWYAPALGRFTRPDPIVPSPGNPQDLNRYSYVRNNPLRYTDPTGHCVTPMGVPIPGCMETVMRLAQQAEALAVQYGPQVTAFLQANIDKLPAVVDQVAQFAREAGNRIQGSSQGGNPADPGGLDPNDPFRNPAESIGQGVETLRRQISNPRNYAQYRYGAQANLSRAEYYQRQGLLQSVNPTGRGSIDLVLTNNTGVEVKYWTADYLSRNVRPLANQLRGFSKLNLDRITVEFVETRGDAVTQAMLADLQRQLMTQYELDLSNIVFRAVSNPGIP